MTALCTPGPAVFPENSMRRVFVGFALALALAGAGAAFSILSGNVVAAPRENTSLGEGIYLVPANDGYGIADCIEQKRSCGKSVAETWCLSHGYKTALSYGVAERSDFTGSVPRGDSAGKMPIVISCGK
jgi:hypothetical protein